VDESESEIRKFMRFAHGSLFVTALKPIADLNEMIDNILTTKVDALVADFDLNEEDSTIKYTGVELISKLLENREKFPVFILTSHEDKAIQEGDDVNIVYEKGRIFDSKEKLLEKIKSQIDKYTHSLYVAEDKIMTLLEKQSQANLTAVEEEELIRLDNFIEKSLGKKIAIPEKLKSKQESDGLIELLEKADKILKKIQVK
jgi:DNA-binding NarL/FixJ family response regulator